MSVADTFVVAVEGAELIPPNRSTSCLLHWPQPQPALRPGDIFNCPASVQTGKVEFQTLAVRPSNKFEVQKRKPFSLQNSYCHILNFGVCVWREIYAHMQCSPAPQDMRPLAARGNWVSPRGVNNKSSAAFRPERVAGYSVISVLLCGSPSAEQLAKGSISCCPYLFPTVYFYFACVFFSSCCNIH